MQKQSFHFQALGPPFRDKDSWVWSLACLVLDCLVFPPFLGVHRQPWDLSWGDRICTEPAASSCLCPSALTVATTRVEGGAQPLSLGSWKGWLKQRHVVPLSWVSQILPGPSLTSPFPSLWFGVLFTSIPHLHPLLGVVGNPFCCGAEASPAREGQMEGGLC